MFPKHNSQTQLATFWLLDGNVASCVLQLMHKEQFPFRGRDGEKDKTTITGARYQGLAAYSQRKTDESICDNENDLAKKENHVLQDFTGCHCYRSISFFFFPAFCFFYRPQAKWVVLCAAYCPEDMEFHDNSKHSINCRALVQSGMTRWG